MTTLNKNYPTMAGTNDAETIDDTNATQIGEIETDMDTIETDLTQAQDDITTNDTATALNTTHRTSDGKDHSDVVLNNAHRVDTNNPHSVDIDDVTTTTTKGDILVENGSNVIRVPVGSNTEVLSANSSEASGVQWVPAGTPAAHNSSHEDGGGDEIDITGLSGIPTDLDTHASTEKTTPVAADELSLFDSASSFVLKKLSFLNLKTTIGSYLMPVGTIKEFNISTNPNTLYGFGTWSLHGVGKTSVCIDTGDTDFDTVDETRGDKTHTLSTAELAAHEHKQTAKNVQSGTGAEVLKVYDGTFTRESSSIGGNAAHNNIQPSIVTYRWVRTA